MSYRLMELMIPADKVEPLMELVSDLDNIGIWKTQHEDEVSVVRILATPEQTEEISDVIGSKFAYYDSVRMMLLDVVATLPLPKEEEKQPEEQVSESEAKKPGKKRRVSLEEIYNDVTEGLNVSWVYLLTIILAAVVASVGLIRNDVAVIIGAMVIAPMLTPNVALALAATLGDVSLTIRSLKVGLTGFLGVAVISFILGLIFNVDPAGVEIASRTEISIGNIIIAMAAGSMGALAFTTGVPATLIGVMVAVALVPVLSAAGLLAGAGYWSLAFESILLFFVNVICVNLAGVITFLFQGVEPRHWWEKKKARRAITRAIIIWTVLLTIALAIIWYLNSLAAE